MKPLLKEELKKVTEAHPEGLTSQQIVSFFKMRGVRMSEATFRKYVQMGLLPRSRRIGRKGRHKGSRGIYPPKVLERIAYIRALMDEGYTMEEIQNGVMRFRGRIDDVERSVKELFVEFEKEIDSPRFETELSRKRSVANELDEAKKTAKDLLSRLEGLEKSLTETLPASTDDSDELSGALEHKYF